MRLERETMPTPLMRNFSNDRRSEPRLVPVEPRCLIGWWNGEDFEVARSSLVNISRGGASLTISEPPEGDEVWFCLDVNHWLGSVQASLLGYTQAGPGCYNVRVRFPGPCPDELFRAASEGLGAVVTPEPPLGPPEPASVEFERLPDMNERHSWVAIRIHEPSVH